MYDIRIEYYHDLQPELPNAFEKFMYRLSLFQNEYELYKDGTVVLDSLTFTELAARNREMYVLNRFEGGGSPYARGAGFDTRQWHAGATTALEGVAITRFSGLPMNVVVCAHVHERQNELNGEILRGPFAPGRLSKRGMLCAAFMEQYRAYTLRDDQGKRQFALQTENDGGWAATSQLGAPNPCYPDYEALWVNWGLDRMPIHVLLYSETGTGKSTMASTFPKPMLVWSFDPTGKETPYFKGAKEVSAVQEWEIPVGSGVVSIPYRDVKF